MKTEFSCFPSRRAPLFYSCPLLDASGLVRHGFSTRLGGVSSGPFASLNLGMHTEDAMENIMENYSIFCDAVGIARDRLVLTHQVHSAKIRIVTEQDAGKGLAAASDLGEFDGLITSARRLPIAVFYADCSPILLLDPVKKVVAAVHSGWKGTLAKIGTKAVRMMRRQFGCRPADILAAFGPSIKQCHFEVDEDVFLQFCETFGDDARRAAVQKGVKFYLDTDWLNLRQLLREGLTEEHISQSDVCTFCRHDILFSHRADGGKTGRMCAAIELL